MNVSAIKTHKITHDDQDLLSIIDKYVGQIEDGSILAVTSKIVAICEGRIVPVDGVDKDELIEQESQYFLPRNENPYNVSLTITRNNLIASAGIDESNANGFYILWPQDPQKSANKIREYLVQKFGLEKIGVIITDSRTMPFRWGVTAFSIAHSGFVALKSYIGADDLFGRKFQFETVNIPDSLATSAALVMGEGSEQTPLSLITDVPFVDFQDRNPTDEEIGLLLVDIKSDLYSPIISSAPWKKGKK